MLQDKIDLSARAIEANFHNVRFADYRQWKYKDASNIASLMDSIASVTLGREKMIYFLIM